jgi:hypothetical protein
MSRISSADAIVILSNKIFQIWEMILHMWLPSRHAGSNGYSAVGRTTSGAASLSALKTFQTSFQTLVPTRMPMPSLSNRRRQIFIFTPVVLIVLLFLTAPHRHLSSGLEQPPKYEFLYEWERNLPQHDIDLPYPEGRTGRYVMFRNQIRALGWNNVFNEMCVSHLNSPPQSPLIYTQIDEYAPGIRI